MLYGFYNLVCCHISREAAINLFRFAYHEATVAGYNCNWGMDVTGRKQGYVNAVLVNFGAQTIKIPMKRMFRCRISRPHWCTNFAHHAAGYHKIPRAAFY